MSRRASGKPSGSRHWSSASASHGSLVAAALAGECARVCAVWSSLAPPSRSENEGDASPAPRSRSSLLWMARCASRTRAGSPLFVARSQRRVSRSFGTSGKYSRVMMASRRATYSSSSSTTGPARRGARGAGGGISSAPASRRDATAGGPAPPTAALPSAEDMPRDARARCGRARCGRARAGLAVLGRALDSSTFSAPAPFSPLRRARFLVFFARGTPGSASEPQTKRRVKSRETPRLRSHEKAPPEIAPAADSFDATAQSVEMPRAAAPASLSR